jgi:hypothetical protein
VSGCVKYSPTAGIAFPARSPWHRPRLLPAGTGYPAREEKMRERRRDCRND